MSNELVTTSQTKALSVGLNINSVADLRAFAADIAASGIIGQVSPTQAEVSLVAMRDDGISIVEFKRKYQWVGNELSTRPNWLLGEFRRRGGKYTINRADRDVCDMTFTNADGMDYRMAISMDDMKKTSVPFGKDGKTLKTNWQNFPDDMLFARVCGKALRRVAPELMGGIYTDGEAMDFDNAPKASPAPVVDVAKDVEERTAPIVPEVVDGPEVTVVIDSACVCPVKGKLYGKAWVDMTTQVLEKVLKSDAKKFPELTDEHRNAIISILGEREAAEQVNDGEEE